MEQRNKAEAKDMLDVFRFPIHARDPEKGIMIDEYRDALELQVKVPLCVVYNELCELISSLPQDEMDQADAYILIFKNAMTLWELIDERVSGMERLPRGKMRPSRVRPGDPGIPEGKQ